MYKLLLPIFSAVCGENPGHIWSPGGQPLPCCQRCAGLYVAALVATALHLWLRPRMSRGFLRLHALFLLQLGLFLFPWVPSSPLLRSVSGSLFGFGVVAFLAPAIRDGCPPLRLFRFRARAYALGLAGCLALIPAIAEWGGRPGALVLMCLVLAGALALAVLTLANLARCLFRLASQIHNFRPRFFRRSQRGNVLRL
ncbi:MAG: DUF2085 domain-containing protein [Verrucomicrobiota bacterium]|jgi:uncharacterized membrane protein